MEKLPVSLNLVLYVCTELAGMNCYDIYSGDKPEYMWTQHNATKKLFGPPLINEQNNEHMNQPSFGLRSVNMTRTKLMLLSKIIKDCHYWIDLY